MTQAVFDIATQLKAPTAAVTATTSETGIALPVRFLATCDWVVYVTALGVVGTETYVFTLQVSDLVGGTYTTIATLTWPIAHGVGKMHVPINGDLASFYDTDSKFVRVTATLGGTTPTITYGSYLTKEANKLGIAAAPGNIVTSP